MTPTPELPLHIDSTMISTFRSCQQKFYKEFVLGLRPAGLSIDLHAGACFASALENVYIGAYTKGLSLEAALRRAYGKFLQQWGNFVIMKDTPKTPDRVWGAVEEYFTKFGLQTDPVQPYILDGKPSMEFTFAVPLLPATNDMAEFVIARGIGDGEFQKGDRLTASYGGFPQGFPLHPSGQPFLYSGRLDMLGLYAGKLIGRDEKTTTSIGAAWAEQWDLRSQFMGYIWALQQFGLDIDTICVRGIGILKTKYTIGHEAEIFKTFARWEIDRWYEQLRRDLWRMRRCWDEGYWDYNLADACTSYGGCAFKDVCKSPNPERWYANYVVRRWNPLNKNPIEETSDV